MCWLLISLNYQWPFVAGFFLSSAVEHKSKYPSDESDSFYQRELCEKNSYVKYTVALKISFTAFAPYTFGRRWGNDIERPLPWIHQSLWAVQPNLITRNFAFSVSQICRVIVGRCIAPGDFGMLVDLLYPIGYKLFILSSAS